MEMLRPLFEGDEVAAGVNVPFRAPSFHTMGLAFVMLK